VIEGRWRAVNAGNDPEAAAWERARQLQIDREDADRDERAQREQAARDAALELARAERKSDRRSLVVWLLGFVAVAVVVAGLILVIASRASDNHDVVGSPDASSAAAPTDEAEQRLAPFGPTNDTAASGRRASPSLDADTPPPIDLTGDDFDKVWRQAQVLEGWLLRHPRPELVEDIYVPDTPTYAEVRGFIDDLARNGRAVVVERYRILAVELVDRPADDEVELRYSDTYDFRELIDVQTNHVIDHQSSDGQPRMWSLVLRRSADGEWRATSITPWTATAADQSG
jgi:hypothetical protein